MNAPRATIEEWRPTDYPGYEVSNLGRVRSFHKRGGDQRQFGQLRLGTVSHILRPGLASHGYPTVVCQRGNTQSVHVLVARAFLGPCPPDCEVRHKDDNRENPIAANLEYGTRLDNVTDMMRRRGHWRRR